VWIQKNAVLLRVFRERDSRPPRHEYLPNARVVGVFLTRWGEQRILVTVSGAKVNNRMNAQFTFADGIYIYKYHRITV